MASARIHMRLSSVVPVEKWAEYPRLKRRNPRLVEMGVSEVDLKRFASWIVKRGPDDCWPWTGYKDRTGYGKIYIMGSAVRAPRFMMYCNGVILLPKMWACHRCDNPGCVNPRHLFPGNDKANGEDMVAKGRSPFGEKNGHARLTWAVVREIRRLFEAGMNQREIRDQFNILATNAHNIVHWKRWVRDPLTSKPETSRIRSYVKTKKPH